MKKESSFFVESLKKLHHLNNQSFDSLEEFFQCYLQEGCELFNLSSGVISQIEGNRYVIRAYQSSGEKYVQGQEFELQGTYCHEVIGKDSTVAYHYLGQMESVKDHPSYENLKLEAYIGTPIYVQDKTFGTLSFSSSRPRKEPFSEFEIELIELMAESLGSYIENHQIEQERNNFFQMSLEMLCIAGFDGYFKRLNPRWEEVLGFTIEELKAQPFIEFVHPDDREKTLKAAEKVNQDIRVVDFENRYLCRDGSYRWLRWKANSLIGMEEIYALAQDITEEKKREKSLIQRTNRLQLLNSLNREVTLGRSRESIVNTILERIHDSYPEYRVVYMVIDSEGELNILGSKGPDNMKDLSGLVLDLNQVPGYLHTLRDKREEIVSEDVAQDPALEPLREAIIDGGAQAIIDVPLDHEPGKTGVLCFDSPHPQKWTDEEVLALREIAEFLALTFKDLRTQEELHSTKLYLEYIFKAIPEGIVVADSERTVNFVNPAFTELFGYQPEEVIGGNTKFLYANPDDFGHQGKERYNKNANPSLKAYEVEYRRKNGETFLSQTIGSPLRNQEGEVIGFVGVIRDITEEKEIQNELLQARDLAREANRAKSLFLANMSHELRTPLNAIIGYSEMLMEDFQDEGDDGTVTDLNRIRKAGKDLLHLINDILDLSKIEAGKMELYWERFSLNSLVDNVISTVKPMVKKNQNVLEVKVDEGPEFIYSDHTKLRQILLNLISNASKFTKDGTILFQVKKGEAPKGEVVKFIVQDTGIGIPENKLKKLFQSFTQADPSTTRKYGGTGLGLAISKRFSELLGGKIEVESQEGEGATFTVTLPLEGRDDAFDKEDDFSSLHLEKDEERDYSSMENLVLAIDDDLQALDLLKRGLEKEGFNVLTAQSGEEGLKLARSLRPQAIILDVLMPNVDGWTVLKEIKDDPDLELIPVIMVTMMNDRSLGYALGASHYLNKPVQAQELAEVISRYGQKETENTALVVEDDEHHRNLMKMMLEREKWKVFTAENGRKALEVLEEKEPQVILLDLMMPEMDGFELVEILKEDRFLNRIPILVVTAKSLEEEDLRRLNSNVEKIVQKGGRNLDSFLGEVKKMLAQISYSK